VQPSNRKKNPTVLKRCLLARVNQNGGRENEKETETQHESILQQRDLTGR